MNSAFLSFVDMHCDLLLYLAKDLSRTPLNPEVRCSIPQLKKGHVKLQTMAVFTETKPGSILIGQNQLQSFRHLVKNYPQDFQILKNGDCLKTIFPESRIKILLAIENASSLFEENEPIENGFQRMDTVMNETGKIFYISFTWNFENRFGGGAHTSIGLKEDGSLLLDFLDKKQIAVDLSHASDPLAMDILNYIDKKGLKIPVLASHSNFRAIRNVPRNLPDEIASEIIRREGLIGFVLCRDFIGSRVYDLIRQFEHLVKLGGGGHGSFGADFFFGGDLPLAFAKPEDRLFFPGFDDATVYESILELWKGHLAVPEKMLTDFAYRNFMNFYEKLKSFA